ncbi:sensor histidine kinase [Sphingobacterium lactis]|uniref:sensor histidine kinase n=1 Tax=Sphingobacterium lactis TaxID=797291 RepID=UPI003DA4E673
MKGHEIEFGIRDTGIGIRSEDQSRVFEKYFIGDERNGSQVFGIGMYISRVFAEQMNGKLTLQNRYGKGTKFTLKTPIDAMEMRQVKGVPPTLKDLASDLPIVFIEDNPINLLFLESYFRDFLTYISSANP